MPSRRSSSRGGSRRPPAPCSRRADPRSPTATPYRLLVVSGSPPEISLTRSPLRRIAAHPPGPGFPEQAPSVHSSTGSFIACTVTSCHMTQRVPTFGRAQKPHAPLRHPLARRDGGARTGVAAPDLRDRNRVSARGSARPLPRSRQKVEDSVVKFDPDFVVEQVTKAPSEYQLLARNPERDVHVGGRQCPPTQGPPFVRLGDERREGTLQDFDDFCRLSQSFDQLDTAGGLPCEPNDLPFDSRHLDMLLVGGDPHRQAVSGRGDHRGRRQRLDRLHRDGHARARRP